LRRKKGTNRLMGWPQGPGAHLPPWGAPPSLVIPSSIVSHGFFFPKIIYIPKKISIDFYPVWTPFDMDILRNKKHATNRNWHWALDQYVSPKNSIKSCQKYMKVVEYWHGTIKNYRYDGDVSECSPALGLGCKRTPPHGNNFKPKVWRKK